MKIALTILRQTPDRAPWSQRYELDVEPGNTILDCLNRIKWEQDGTLTFRKNCRNTICGSCAMRINGRSTLACKESVAGELTRLQAIAPENPDRPDLPTITIAPMGNMPVIKDLVVNMTSFWDHLKAIEPTISTASRPLPAREFLQSPEQRAQLNQTGNCILCGACYSECNAREVNPDFVGPHALAKAWRTLADNRDDRHDDRLTQYNNPTTGAWGCTRCYYCNTVCPMDVAPMDQIGQIKAAILVQTDVPQTRLPQTRLPQTRLPQTRLPQTRLPQSDTQAVIQPESPMASRALRHRRVLVDLVKAGGWIDERQFGVQVVGDRFRDIRGLLSLVPLGLAMIRVRKFPLWFEPSEGTATVRALITAVQSRSSLPAQSTTKPVTAAQTEDQKR